MVVTIGLNPVNATLAAVLAAYVYSLDNKRLCPTWTARLE